MKRLWPFVVGPLAVFGLVAALGYLEQHPDALKAQRAVGERWLVGPQPEPEECGSASYTIDPPWEEDEDVAVVWGDWVRVDADALTLTWGGSIKLTNILADAGAFASASMNEARIRLGHVDVRIESMGDVGCPAAVQALVPPGADFTWWLVTVFLGEIPFTGPGYDTNYYLIAWNEGGGDGGIDEIDLAYTVTQQNLDLFARHGSEPPADRPARAPQDFHGAHQWLTRADETSKTTLTLGPMYKEDGTEVTLDTWGFLDAGISAFSSTVFGALHDGRADTTYLEITVNCDGYPAVFDGWDVLFYNDRARAWGAGNMTSWQMLVDYAPSTGSDSATATINALYIADFSELYVWRIGDDGAAESMDDVEVDILGVTATAAEWRAWSPVIWQNNSWGTSSNWSGVGTPTGGTIQPRINEDWAAANNERDDDCNIHVDCGPADWACQGSPYRVPVTMSHDGEADPMLPPGLGAAPSTWVGGPGVVVT